MRSERHQDPGAAELPAIEVHLDVPEGHERRLPDRSHRAAHHRAQARQELVGRIGLGDVVVRPRVQRRDLLGLVADGRDDQDRRLAPRAKPPADLETAAVGEQEVEEDGVRGPQACRLERLLTVPAPVVS